MGFGVNIRERLAKAMYEAPYADELAEDVEPWPPSHPEDREWWLSRADAVLPILRDNMLDSPNDNDHKEVPND